MPRGDVVGAARPVHGLRAVGQALDSGRQQGKHDDLDAGFVHQPQALVLDVQQPAAMRRPRLLGEVLARLLDDVGIGSAEVFLEGDLADHAASPLGSVD
ncbi:hypothetical protein AB0K15_19895 [Amycolatopsis sp. NPDC049253]|uniref:hypothetical protein n=1 Tax=Amycolatopsis sp. NPDC049253 TaxID=3155274 RepID=UPI003439F16A